MFKNEKQKNNSSNHKNAHPTNDNTHCVSHTQGHTQHHSPASQTSNEPEQGNHLLTHKQEQDNRLLKQRFLEAVARGDLGTAENSGIVVTLKEFKAYFTDIRTKYISSFMPAAAFEPGQCSVSHTKYLFRVRRGAYLVHPDALKEFQVD